MKLLQTLWIVNLVLIYSAVGDMLFETNTSDNNATNKILYPRSAVDLILKFYKTYKHVKRLTLFLCDNSLTTHLSFPIEMQADYYRVELNAKVQREATTPAQNVTDPKLKQKQQLLHGCLNFQQIVKYLMASGNFLIKGDGNIDATMFTTPGYDCNDVKYEKLDSSYAYRFVDMLERGDFKQGSYELTNNELSSQTVILIIVYYNSRCCT